MGFLTRKKVMLLIKEHDQKRKTTFQQVFHI